MTEQNLVSANLTGATRDAALADIASCEAKLPFLIGLSPGDRVGLQKMGNIRRAFVEETVVVAAQNAQVLPASFDAAEYQKDKALFDQLVPIYDALQVLFEKVDDTLLALGSDLYSASLEVYGYVRAAGKSQALDSLRAQLKAARQKAPVKKPTSPATP